VPTTGDAARPSSPIADDVSLEEVIGSSVRLDELSAARVIEAAAERVDAAHRASARSVGASAGLSALAPDAVRIARDGSVSVSPAPRPPAPGYLAPERLRGSPGDRRSDVFTLGVLLWEVLAHERLPAGDTDAIASATGASAAAPPPPSAYNANVPPELDAICRKALAADPADRYPSPKVLAAEIATVLDDASYPEGNARIAAWVASAAHAGASPAAHATAIGMPAPREPALAPTAATAPVPHLTATSPPRDRAPAAGGRDAGAHRASPMPAPALDGSRDLAARAPRPTPAPSGLPGAGSHASGPRGKPATAPPIPGPDPAGPRGIPSLAARSKPPTPAPSHGPGSSLPAWALARGGAAAPAASPPREPVEAAAQALGSPRDTQPVPALSAGAASAVAATAPLAAAPWASAGGPGAPAPLPQTIVGMPDSARRPSAPPSSPLGPVADAGTAPTSPAALPYHLGPIPGGTVPAAQPSKLGAARPGMQTEILGSLGAPLASGLAAIAGPAAADDEVARITRVQWHDSPPPPPPPPLLPVSIAQAETVGTAALGGRPGFEHTAVGHPYAGIPRAPATDARAGDPLAPAGDPVGAALAVGSQRPRARTETNPAAKSDMLGGWGWSTGAHDAFVDDAHDADADRPRASRKRLALAVGGALAVAAAITGIALAAGRARDASPQPAVAPAAASAQAGSAAAPSAPPAGPPAVPAEPSAAAAAEPAASVGGEPAAPREASAPPPAPARDPGAEPAAATPPAGDPSGERAAEAEPAPPPPPSAAPPSRAAGAPPRGAVRPEARGAGRPAARRADRPRVADGARPIDPYETAAPETRRGDDPAAAYRAGLQQLARGDHAAALATFRASLAASPGYAPTWRGIAIAYEKLGRAGQARTALLRYLELAPDAPDAGQIRERLERLR
jgi:hypothetical protein